MERLPRLSSRGAGPRWTSRCAAAGCGWWPSVEDMARDDVFESDQELDEFLAYVYAERHANLT